MTCYLFTTKPLPDPADCQLDQCEQNLMKFQAPTKKFIRDNVTENAASKMYTTVQASMC